MHFRKRLYRYYHFFARISHVFKCHTTLGGYFIFALVATVPVYGLNTNRSLSYQLFSVGVVLIICSIVWNVFAKGPQFSLKRMCPRFATVGAEFKYRIQIKNLTRRTYPRLRFREWGELQLPTLEAFLHQAEPGESKRNRFDRRFLYYRWQWLCEKLQFTDLKPSDSRALPANASIELDMQILPQRRGLLHLNELRVLQADIFGLFYASRSSKNREHTPVIVLPKRYHITEAALLGKACYQPGGFAVANVFGLSEEFVGLRDYFPGDSLRHVHWKSWARQGKPIVKEYEDEYFPRFALVLDTFPVEGKLSEDIFEEAVSVASSFAYQLDSNETLLDLMFVGTEAHCFTSGRGTSDVEKMLEVLATVQPCYDHKFATLNELIYRHIRDLSSCIFVLTGWNDERKQCIEKVRQHSIEVRAIVLYSKLEASEANTENAPEYVTFIDIEKVEESLAQWK